MSASLGPDLLPLPEEWWEQCCEVCGASMDWEDCDLCGGEGVSGHDCGEDVCCCLYPEDNETCHQCDGKGGWWYCWNRSAPEHQAARLEEERKEREE
jgi:hypothetical protein